MTTQTPLVSAKPQASNPIPTPDTPKHGAIAAIRHVGGAVWGRAWLIGGVALVLGLGYWQGVPLIFGPQVAADQVTRGDVIETVVATGSVQTPYRVQIQSQITGTVASVDVDEGQRVTKGQRLISIENSELSADLVQAQGAVAQAEAHMRQLTELTVPSAQDALAQAKATQLNAQKAFNRATNLVRTGDETRVVLDAARRDLDLSSADIRTYGLQIYTSSPGGSDYVTGQTLLDQARAGLAVATSRLADATITAPRAGVLIARSVENGAVVAPGTTLLALAPDGQVQLLLAIDERNLGKLAMAQSAIASADAYADQKFTATVSYINPGVDITKASVEVKLDVASPPDYLRQDMTVSVDIDVGEHKNALLLPSRSVNDQLTETPWVLLVKGGRATHQAVKIGLQGNAQTEILQGVAEGDLVIPSNAAVSAGSKVRAAVKIKPI